METRQTGRIKFGNEVYFESCTVGCDNRGVIYIRTTGLDGPVQLVRIKPSEFEKVTTHLASRKDNPLQGYTARHRKEFVPLSERISNGVPDDDEDEQPEVIEEEQPVVLLSSTANIRQRQRTIPVEPIEDIPIVSPEPIRSRVRIRASSLEPTTPFRIRRLSSEKT